MESSEESSLQENSIRSCENSLTEKAGGTSESSDPPLSFQEDESIKEEIKAQDIVQEEDSKTYVASEEVSETKYTGDKANLAALKSEATERKTLKDYSNTFKAFSSDLGKDRDVNSQNFDFGDKFSDFAKEFFQQNSGNKTTSENSREHQPKLWSAQELIGLLPPKEQIKTFEMNAANQNLFFNTLRSWGMDLDKTIPNEGQVPELINRYNVQIISKEAKKWFYGGYGSFTPMWKHELNCTTPKEFLDQMEMEFDEKGDLDVFKAFVDKSTKQDVDWVTIELPGSMFAPVYSQKKFLDLLKILSPFRSSIKDRIVLVSCAINSKCLVKIFRDYSHVSQIDFFSCKLDLNRAIEISQYVKTQKIQKLFLSNSLENSEDQLKEQISNLMQILQNMNFSTLKISISQNSYIGTLSGLKESKFKETVKETFKKLIKGSSLKHLTVEVDTDCDLQMRLVENFMNDTSNKHSTANMAAASFDLNNLRDFALSFDNQDSEFSESQSEKDE